MLFEWSHLTNCSIEISLYILCRSGTTSHPSDPDIVIIKISLNNHNYCPVDDVADPLLWIAVIVVHQNDVNLYKLLVSVLVVKWKLYFRILWCVIMIQTPGLTQLQKWSIISNQAHWMSRSWWFYFIFQCPGIFLWLIHKDSSCKMNSQVQRKVIL